MSIDKSQSNLSLNRNPFQPLINLSSIIRNLMLLAIGSENQFSAAFAKSTVFSDTNFSSKESSDHIQIQQLPSAQLQLEEVEIGEIPYCELQTRSCGEFSTRTKQMGSAKVGNMGGQIIAVAMNQMSNINCQVAPSQQQLECGDAGIVMDQSLMTGKNAKTNEKRRAAIYKGIYYDYRLTFVEWLHGYCVSMKLNRMTFSAALSLMDEYYALEKYDSVHLVANNLSFMLIASKCHQFRVLSTAVIAKHEKYAVRELAEREFEIMKWFKFRVSRPTYNSILSEYMLKWSTQGGQLFFQESLDSYLRARKVYFLADMQIKHNLCLTSREMKLIFLEIFGYCLLIDQIFQQVSSECEWTYQYRSQDHPQFQTYLQNTKMCLHKWSQQFDNSKASSCQRQFRERNCKSLTHGELLGLQLD